MDSSVTIARNLLFNGPVKAISESNLFRAQIDAYSYIGYQSSVVTAKIGRYCSIGQHVEIGLGYHDYKLFTTSPVVFHSNSHFQGICDRIEDYPKWLVDNDYIDTAQPVIGNDVWIGAHALIPASVTIGHGAVIGAGAVITKDVPPYAIVSASSNDRRTEIKYRFPDEVIADLLELNWWNYDLPKMLANGKKIPRDNVKDFISFMKNEDLSEFILIPDNWRLMAIINPNKVHFVKGQKDMFMDFLQIDLN